MKILDPSSSTLTLSEIHHFFTHKLAQTPTHKSGAYAPVSLHGYTTVRRDFDLYLSRSAPHVPLLPPPKDFIPRLLHRFQERGISLTKGEVLGLVDLGVGVKRPQSGEQTKEEEGEGADERDDYTLLTAVIEEAESRFGDDQLSEILGILRAEMPLLVQSGKATEKESAVSVPVTSPDSGVYEVGEEAEVIDEEEAEDGALLYEVRQGRKENDGDIDGEE